jgi:2-keto-4-pentenoate hydratase
MTDERAQRAATLLLDARKTGRALADLPADCRPGNAEEAYAVQDEVAKHLGPIRGWKTGAATPEAEPAYAPIFTVAASPARFPAKEQRVFGIEAEIAFKLGNDLRPRTQLYSREEVIAAIASMHPAIELIDSRFTDWPKADTWSKVADNQSNSALIHGAAVADWQSLGLDLARPPITVTIDGAVAAQTTGNSGGDPLRLLTALANHCTRRTGGLRQGDFVTTGSITGVAVAKPGASVVADFGGLGTVRLTFPV